MNHLLYIAALGAGFIPLTPPKLVVAPFARCAPLPSRSQCLDPGFWQRCADRVSEAGRLQCAALAQAELDALGALPEVSTLDDAGAARPASVVADYEDTPSLSGLLGGASGSVLELVARRRDSARVTAADRRRFADNCSVTSCDEYIFDKYFDLVDFEVRTADVFDDPVARFGELYGAEGLARRRLRDVEGRPISSTPITLERRRGAKNHFLAFDIQRVEVDWPRVSKWGGFGVPQGPNIDESLRANCNFDADSQRFTCGPNATNRDLLAAEQANQALAEFDGMQQRTLQLAHTPTPPEDVDPWDFHAASASTLASQPPELLLELYEAGEAFAALSERRYAAAQRVSDLVGWMDFFDSESELPPDENLRMIGIIRRSLVASVTELRGIDTEVNERLAFAERAGCLTNGSLGPCDWSHQWVLDEVDQLFIEERERDYQRCVSVTGGDFSLLHAETGQHWLQTAAADDDFCTRGGSPVPNCRVQQSYIATPDEVETYFSTVEAWFDSLPVPRDPETGELLLGQGAGDEARLGDGRFGASYDYGVGYTSRRWQDGFCAAELDTSAHLSSDVSAFGVSSARLGGLLRTSVNTQAGPNGASASMAVRVLGLDIYVPDDFEGVGPDALRFAVAEVQSEAIRHGLQESFLVGPIPFVAKAGFAGEVGLQFDLQGGQSGCPGNGTLSSGGTILPFAKLGAYAGAAAGIDYLASAGVRTKLTLLDFGLPFALEARFPAEGRFDVSTDLSARWAMLRGRVELYAELGPKEWKRTLVRWPGHSGRTGYWSRRYGGDSETLVRLASGGDAGRSPPPDLTLDSGRSCRAPVQLPAPTLYFSFDDTTVDTAARGLRPVVGSADAGFGDAVQPGRSGLVAQSFEVDGSQSEGSVVVADWGLRTGLGRGAHTMSLWFNPQTDPAAVGGYALLGFGDAQAGFRLLVDARSRLVFESYDAGGVRGWNTLLEVQRNLWQPLLLEIGGGDVRVTLGRAAAARSQTLDLGGSALRIGSALGSSRSGWSGRVDELAAWSTALTIPEQAEVKRRGGDGRPLQGPGAALPVGVTELVAEPRNGSADLRWTNPPGLGAEFSATQIYIGLLPIPDDRSGAITVYGGTESSAEVTPLQNGTTYHFRAFALRPDGTLLPGPSAVATPSASALPAPTNVVASSVSGGVLLSWSRPASARYDQMVVVRRTDRAPLHPLDGRVIFGLDDIEHLDTGLAAGETGYYGVAGVDIRRQFGPMVTVQAEAGGAGLDETAPDPVSNLAGTSDGSRVTLTWTSPSAPDLAGIRIERAQGTLPRFSPISKQLAETFEDRLVNPGDSYIYRVTALDRSGNQSLPRSVRVAVSSRPAPVVTGLSASAGTGQVTLEWSSPTAARVLVRRSRLRPVSSPTGGSAVFDGQGTGFVDSNPPTGVVYYSAFAEGSSGFGEPRSVRVAVDADAPPDPVSQLRGVASDGGLSVSWVNPSDTDLASIEVRHASARFDASDPMAPGVVTAQNTLAESVLIDAHGTRHIAVTSVDRAGQRSTPRWLVLRRPVVLQAELSCTRATAPNQGGNLFSVGRYSDGSPVSHFEWRQTAGPTATLSRSDVAAPTMRAPASGFAPTPEKQTMSFEVRMDGTLAGRCDVVLDIIDDEGVSPADLLDSGPQQDAQNYAIDPRGYFVHFEDSTMVVRNLSDGVERSRIPRAGGAGYLVLTSSRAYALYETPTQNRTRVMAVSDFRDPASATRLAALGVDAPFLRFDRSGSVGIYGLNQGPVGPNFTNLLEPTGTQTAPNIRLGQRLPSNYHGEYASFDAAGTTLYSAIALSTAVQMDDVRNPNLVQNLGSFPRSGLIGEPLRMETFDDRLVLLATEGFQVFDISTPIAPVSLLVEVRTMTGYRRIEGDRTALRFAPQPEVGVYSRYEQYWDSYLDADISSPSTPVLTEYATPGDSMTAVGGGGQMWTYFREIAPNLPVSRMGRVASGVAPLDLTAEAAADPLAVAFHGDTFVFVDGSGVQHGHYEPSTGRVVLDGRASANLVDAAGRYLRVPDFDGEWALFPSMAPSGGVLELDVRTPANPSTRHLFGSQAHGRATRVGRFVVSRSNQSELWSIDTSSVGATPRRFAQGVTALLPAGDRVVGATSGRDYTVYVDDGASSMPVASVTRLVRVGRLASDTHPTFPRGDELVFWVGGLGENGAEAVNLDLNTLEARSQSSAHASRVAAGSHLNWFVDAGGDLVGQVEQAAHPMSAKDGARFRLALPKSQPIVGLTELSDGALLLAVTGKGFVRLRPAEVGLTAGPAYTDSSSRRVVDVDVRFEPTRAPIRYAHEPTVSCHATAYCEVTARDLTAGTATVRWQPGAGSTLRVSVGDAYGYAVGTLYGEAP